MRTPVRPLAWLASRHGDVVVMAAASRWSSSGALGCSVCPCDKDEDRALRFSIGRERVRVGGGGWKKTGRRAAATVLYASAARASRSSGALHRLCGARGHAARIRGGFVVVSRLGSDGRQRRGTEKQSRFSTRTGKAEGDGVATEGRRGVVPWCHFVAGNWAVRTALPLAREGSGQRGVLGDIRWGCKRKGKETEGYPGTGLHVLGSFLPSAIAVGVPRWLPYRSMQSSRIRWGAAAACVRVCYARERQGRPGCCCCLHGPRREATSWARLLPAGHARREEVKVGVGLCTCGWGKNTYIHVYN
jgi:hypothetical protein